MSRNPIDDPMPGDKFRNKGGTVLTIIDRFVSKGQRGTEMPGYFIHSVRKDGTESYGSTAIVILRSRKRTWSVVSAAPVEATPWTEVARYPHSEIDQSLRGKHGLAPSTRASKH